jgi:exodeoxyribonuclease V alpha subunit
MLGVHRDGTVHHDADNPLDYDLVVVDEASMVDSRLLDMLLAAMRDDASLLIVGDDNQLPSIGPGDVLKDFIEARVGAVVRLVEIHRQAAESQLVRVSHSILEGKMPTMAKNLDGDDDFVFLPVEDSEQLTNTVRQLVTEVLPRRLGIDAVRDIQVLCPMKKRGPHAVEPLNLLLQEALNPLTDPRQKRMKGLQNSFRFGDKVMQIINCEKKVVNNGETGVVTFLNLKSRTKEALQVTFSNIRGASRVVSYSHSELDEHLTLSYATTIHKSQGCEYPAVVVVLSTDQILMLQRSLLYTAVTRARRAVVVVGQSSSLMYAIKNDDRGDSVEGGRRRWTLLSILLKEHRERRDLQREDANDEELERGDGTDYSQQRHRAEDGGGGW